MGPEMLIVPPLDEPEHNTDSKRDDEQHTDSTKKTEGEDVGHDRPPGNAYIP
jgi:hypothetical protein